MLRRTALRGSTLMERTWQPCNRTWQRPLVTIWPLLLSLIEPMVEDREAAVQTMEVAV